MLAVLIKVLINLALIMCVIACGKRSLGLITGFFDNLKLLKIGIPIKPFLIPAERLLVLKALT